MTILSKDLDFGGTMEATILYFWKSQSKISHSPFITFGDNEIQVDDTKQKTIFDSVNCDYLQDIKYLAILVSFAFISIEQGIP